MDYEDAVRPPVNPPYRVKDNDGWLLDICDIVMIDPVGTGYSLLLDESAAEKYYGVQADARAIAEFIERWLNRHHRRNSPIYLGGESYGTLRTPLVVTELMGGPFSHHGNMRGIAVKGVFLLGTALHLGADSLNVPREPMDLYAEAACAWYHKPEGKKSLREHVEAAWAFGTGEYLSALYRKNLMSAAEKRALCEKLSSFTDVSPEFYLRHDLRCSLEAFASDASGARGFDVGIYDGRYAMPHRENTPAMDPRQMHDPVIDDPAMGRYTPSMTGAMEAIMKERLGINLEREYKAICFTSVNGRWNYEYRVTPSVALERAARRSPEFRVFMGAGLYDLATTPGYARALTQQLDIPAEQFIHREYESGHMPYLGEESFAALTRDMRAFIRGEI